MDNRIIEYKEYKGYAGYNTRISLAPELFCSIGKRFIGNNHSGILDHGFFQQILNKYQYSPRFFSSILYFLYSPKGFEYYQKNSFMNFSIISLLNNHIFQQQIKNPIYVSSALAAHKGRVITRQPEDKVALQPYQFFYSHNVKKSFLRPSIFKSSSAAYPLLREASDIDSHFIKKKPFIKEKPQAHYSSAINNFSYQTHPFHIVRPLLKPSIEIAPMALKAVHSQQNSELSLYYDFLRKRPSDILHWKISRAFLPIPLGKKDGLSKVLPVLPTTLYCQRPKTVIPRSFVPRNLIERFMPSVEMTKRKAQKLTAFNIDRKKRARSAGKESWSPAFDGIDSFYIDKKSINTMNHTSFWDYNLTHIRQRNLIRKNSPVKTVLGYPYEKKADLTQVFHSVIHARQAEEKLIQTKSINTLSYTTFSDYLLRHIRQNSLLKKNHLFLTFSEGEGLPSKSFSVSGYKYASSDMIYFSSTTSPPTAGINQGSQEMKRAESLNIDSSYKINSAKPLPVPELNLYSLADKVYGLILERIKRERDMRGH